MRSLFLLSLFCFAQPCHADSTGVWLGTVQWTFDGEGPDCDAQMAFRENAGEIVALEGYVDCGIVTLETPPLTLKKLGAKLTLDGTVVGDWSENSAHWKVPYSDTVSIETKITITPDGMMDYEDIWTGSEGLIYRISGQLRRQ